MRIYIYIYSIVIYIYGISPLSLDRTSRVCGCVLNLFIMMFGDDLYLLRPAKKSQSCGTYGQPI